MTSARVVNRIAVTVIGGYLGAGKTTLVNHLLREREGRRIAVLVNDFGELSIDDDLIESTDGNVMRLAGGCVCCSFGSDLVAALMVMPDMLPRPEHILIETSGVALPGAPRLQAQNVFESLSLEFSHAVDCAWLAHALGAPELGLVRAKGLLRDLDGAGRVLQLVGARATVSPSAHPRPQDGRLVCIALRGQLDRARVMAMLELARATSACAVPSPV